MIASALPAWAHDEAPKPFWERDNLLPDIGGYRDKLSDNGVTVNLVETSELFGNVAGGLKRGAVYDGMALLSVKVDTEAAGLWEGGTFYLSGIQLHGRGPTLNLTRSLNAVSGVEGTRATRLYDAYFEQKLFGDKASIRIGQMRVDDEFMQSTYGENGEDDDPLGHRFGNAATLFVNSSFGFPTIAAISLPSGGAAFPLPTPAVRLKVNPGAGFTFLAAVFNGDPAGPGEGDPQARYGNGFGFRVRDGVFAIAELQYTHSQKEDEPGLPGTYRIGGWYSDRSFSNQRYDANGIPVASPLSSGVPGSKHGNYNLYVGGDQMVYQTGVSKDHGIGVFGRLMFSPDDRNQVNFFMNAGATWKAPFANREKDTAGIGVTYARISNKARSADQDQRTYGALGTPIRDQETVIEATYSFQAAGWWVIQPDFQYIVHPGGGAASPINPNKRLKDAVVLGVRTIITF